MHLRFIALAVLLSVLLVNSSTVFASPFEAPDQATISGPGIPDERTITDSSILATVQFHELDDTMVRERQTTTEPATGGMSDTQSWALILIALGIVLFGATMAQKHR